MNCYIHIPFCLSKCGYCAFYSETGVSGTGIDLYLSVLEKRLISEPLSTLYIGGGTPTLLSSEQLAKLISILQKKFTFAPEAEISIEANPETLTAEKVALLRTFFTRISLGVQSFDSDLRRKIGRKCSDSALQNALQLIKNAQFPHWNCDLIYSLPDETTEQWENDLHLAAQTGADHISCYSLTPERSALLGMEFTEDDEREYKMFETAEKVLSSYGIYRYEVSNYAVKGAACRHNLNVWRGRLLRGYGPSAADFDGVDRHIQVESLADWLAGEPPEVDHIGRNERLNEIFAVNLRTVSGWSIEQWRAVPFADDWQNRLAAAQKAALKYPDCLQISENSIKLYPCGLLYWNDIAAELL